MAEQEKTVHRKSRGRPPGRLYTETIPLRLTPQMKADLDKWARSEGRSRTEALRALIERALASVKKRGPK